MQPTACMHSAAHRMGLPSLSHHTRPMSPSSALCRSALVALVGATALAACGDTTSSAPDDTQPTFNRQTAARLSALTISVSGLPSGTAAAIRVSNGNGYAVDVTGTTTLSGLANATYLIASSNVSLNGTTYAPSPVSQSVNLKNGASRTISVGYAAVITTGTLNVTISGLDATPAAVTVTGPNGFTRALTSSASLTSLAPGSYTVTAANVTSSNAVIYSATPATQTLAISAGVTTSAPVSYTPTGVPPGGDLNVQILAATLTQSVQTLNNTVTLVAGRDALLRVFPVANVSNTVKPTVRVRVFSNGALQTTLEATTSGTSVPTTIDQGSMARSWNVVIPAAYVQPGLGIQAEADPDRLIPESNDSDNVFPASGSPLVPVVRAVPALNLTMVPVQQGTATVGNITSSNVGSFLADTRDMLPTGTVNWTIRAPYTTSNVLASDGAGWSALLNEIYSLRSTDRSSNHYYGVVKVGYGSGVAGMGYIGAPASIGWDYLPSGNGVLAHELGHNFGRYHAPCGNVSGADSKYPYAGGQIGVFGYNLRANKLWANTAPDLMGYCNPSWISDYNFTAMMNYRGFTTSALLAAGSTGEQPSLLVWGRVEADGELVLEPAMRLTARAVLPSSGGEYRITAHDAAGSALFNFEFTPVSTSNDGVDGGAHFAFVVPLNDAAYERLARLELSGNGRRAERVSRQPANAAAAAARGLDIAAEASSRARLRWNASAFPMVMVRDAQTGEILSFSRNGDASVVTARPDVEVVVSDGVKSQAATVRVRGR
jgi:hypothetical protein